LLLFGGELQLDPSYSENLVHNLYQFSGDIKNLTVDDIYVLGRDGLKNAKGEVATVPMKPKQNPDFGKYYVVIKKANGNPYRLRLNDSFVTDEQLGVLYDIISQTFDAYANGEYPKLTTLPVDIQDNIKAVMVKEIEFYSKNKKPYADLTVKDIVDILIYDETGNTKELSKDVKFRFLPDNTLSLAGNVYTKESLSRKAMLDAFPSKRRNIVLKRKKGSVLGLDNRSYLEYIFKEGVLHTNAVVGKPTFQGNTNIAISKSKLKVNGKLSGFNPNPIKPTSPVKTKTKASKTPLVTSEGVEGPDAQSLLGLFDEDGNFNEDYTPTPPPPSNFNDIPPIPPDFNERSFTTFCFSFNR
jgi:hypothetical protein